MMNVKKKLLGIGLVAMMGLTLATGVLADDLKTNTVDVTVEAGEFSLSTSDINSFGDITLKATPQTYTTSFKDKFTVKDLRGSQAGWRLDVVASPFKNKDNHELPSGALSLAPIEEITGSGPLPTKSTTENVVIDDENVEIAKADAGKGMGVFKMTFPTDALALTVDATTAKVGEYQSTLTWTLVQAP